MNVKEVRLRLVPLLLFLLTEGIPLTVHALALVAQLLRSRPLRIVDVSWTRFFRLSFAFSPPLSRLYHHHHQSLSPLSPSPFFPFPCSYPFSIYPRCRSYFSPSLFPFPSLVLAFLTPSPRPLPCSLVALSATPSDGGSCAFPLPVASSRRLSRLIVVFAIPLRRSPLFPSRLDCAVT